MDWSVEYWFVALFAVFCILSGAMAGFMYGISLRLNERDKWRRVLKMFNL